MSEKIKKILGKISTGLKKKNFVIGSPVLHISLYQKILRGLQQKKIPNLKQLFCLPQILTQREKVIIKVLTLVALTAFIFLITQTIITRLTIAPSVGGSYTEAVVGEPKYINPLLASDTTDLDLTKLIFSGLLKYDSQLNLILDLAQSYEINNEKNIYKFYLKDNLFWHDGEKITAEDIIFTYEKAAKFATKNPFIPNLRNIKIEGADRTVEFYLESPNPNFLNYLTLGIVPKHLWQEVEEKNFYKSTLNLKPVGSGPFRFKSLTKTPNNEVKILNLERYENYHLSPPFIKTINFKFYKNFDEVAKDLAQQKIDGLSYSPIYFKNIHYETNLFKNYSLKLPYYVVLFLNLRKNSYLRFKELRQALAYATPKEKILKNVLNFEGQIIHGPILPDAFGFKKEIKIYEFDPEKSLDLLQKNNWQKSEDDLWTKDNEKLEISLFTVAQPDLEKTAEIIRKAWQDIGIKVKLVTLPAENMEEILKERKYDAFLCGIVETFDSDPYNLWHSSQINYPNLNLSGFSNKRVDELLEKSRVWPFEEVRRKKYAEFQNIIAEEIPAIFLYSTNYNYLIAKKVKGVKIEKINLPVDRFNNINEWYIKTKLKTQNSKVKSTN